MTYEATRSRVTTISLLHRQNGLRILVSPVRFQPWAPLLLACSAADPDSLSPQECVPPAAVQDCGRLCKSQRGAGHRVPRLAQAGEQTLARAHHSPGRREKRRGPNRELRLVITSCRVLRHVRAENETKSLSFHGPCPPSPCFFRRKTSPAIPCAQRTCAHDPGPGWRICFR